MFDLNKEIKDAEEFIALIKDLDKKQKEAIKNVIIGMKLVSKV